MNKAPLDDIALDQIFRTARSQNKWKSDTLPIGTLENLYELLKWGPTSANCCPARFLFIVTQEGKERLRPALVPGNVDKCMTAPAIALIAQDTKFYDKLPQLMPHNPSAREWFASDPQLADSTAFRNSSLQGAYFIIAARALGLDCGPLSGFDPDKINDEFFGGSSLTINFICSFGTGEPEGVFNRSPRMQFSDACQIV